ncbi:YbaB/EbfC family nucleoid-associated protein [Candidatus Mycoplasma mahonii]|uniref:YbaB/EbfC family nucleoid-associated protein n=1 Tax=Candidatus Mycoplasma mahonii TaxID=3004105 RepID=UPI0026ED7A0B|nr:YbaB/EbfC family nucleoid-associated protein [Candidatus Mycoplasma mahonii]WKX02605.1 YbaB/EbfC family nucleoid-associated protein [Candidatus Mycoplasma mahonii]
MNMNAMIQQAKKMQEEMEKSKKKLALKEFTVEKQGVTLVITGDKRIKSININEALVDPEDKDILEDLMIIAFNDAIKLIEEEETLMTPTMPGGGMPF